MGGVNFGLLSTNANDDKIYSGADVTLIFRETKREATCPPYGEGGTVIHEVGSQFGLNHGLK